MILGTPSITLCSWQILEKSAVSINFLMSTQPIMLGGSQWLARNSMTKAIGSTPIMACDHRLFGNLLVKVVNALHAHEQLHSSKLALVLENKTHIFTLQTRIQLTLDHTVYHCSLDSEFTLKYLPNGTHLIKLCGG